ncbi:hypothetical protein HG536_0A00230 [Torulaspora globosa]|uniref:Elongator complex protein 6 n=1 Tax=Torulaspora globosa TaxID=48254 RepID=A0A7G3Z9M0_9SACH|nr:uncharacterized protein HG536_0A00230 [Torulaspora globosa]QLL30206.1 hypothetical protein HG536_0A00230 [Torulaspora globosa]
MGSVQTQELVIFSDNSVLSKELCSGGSHNLITITSSPSNSPFWLINALVESKITGSPHSLSGASQPAPHGTSSDLPVTIGSFIHNGRQFTDVLKKLKIDANSYRVVDLLTDFVAKNIGKPRAKVLSELLDAFTEAPSSMIVLEQPEILLTLLDGLTSDELHRKFILPLMTKCGILLISTNICYSLDGDNRDSVQFARFASGCLYKSIAVLSLRPLETGRATDVTGSLRITRGGTSSTQISCHVVENEYLYLNQRDSTKLFYR